MNSSSDDAALNWARASFIALIAFSIMGAFGVGIPAGLKYDGWQVQPWDTTAEAAWKMAVGNSVVMWALLLSMSASSALVAFYSPNNDLRRRVMTALSLLSLLGLFGFSGYAEAVSFFYG